MPRLRHLLGYIATFILLQPVLLAQSLERSTINSAGSSSTFLQTFVIESPIKATSGSIQYSVGEVLIGTSSGGSILLTQGFQQPSFLEDELLGLEDLSRQIEIYPNPATDFVNLRMAEIDKSDMTIEMFNLNGQAQSIPMLIDTEITLDLRQLKEGEYFIRLTGKHQFALLKLLKIR